MQKCSHSPIRTPPNAHCLPFPPWCALHAPSGGSSRTLAARLPASSPPPRKGTSMGAFVRMRQPRVPPPPTAQIAVSRPPSTPHRPLRQHARAPSICPSCASVRSLADFLGRSPPLYPLTCAQVSPLKSGRGRDGAAIYATGQEWQPRQRPGPLVNVLGGPMGLRAMWGSFESLGDTEL